MHRKRLTMSRLKTAGKPGTEMRRRLLVGAALVAAAAVTAVVLRGGIAASAEAASPGDGLSAYVVLTNRGPLTPCQVAPCTAASLTEEYVHVVNSNPVGN